MKEISPEVWQHVAGQTWLRILRVSHAVDVGLSADGEWLLRVQRPDGAVDLEPVDSNAAVAALPLLEQSLPAVQDNASARAKELAVSSAALIAALPIEAVVRAALRGRSEYWTRLATDWLEADTSSLEAVVEDITPVLGDRRVSQDVRNRLRRISKGSA